LNTGTELLWAKVDAPSIDPAAFEVQQVWYNSKDGTRVPMFVVSKKGLEKNGKNPCCLPDTAGSMCRDAEFQPQHVSLDGAWRHLRGRQPPRRFRVRRRLASRRDAREEQNVFDDSSPPANI